MSARADMRMGQITQLSRRERARSLLSLKTSGIFEYWTLASGEYIMRMSPTGDGDVRGADAHGVERDGDAREGGPDADACHHGQEYPEREQAVRRREPRQRSFSL